MQQTRRCCRCQAPLSNDAPEGFCPACTLEGALLLGASPSSSQRPASGIHPPASNIQFGDYQLLEEIARGGMGIVYRARQLSLNRLVALKLIIIGQFADKSSIRRFKAEASAAARLRHPHIVAIHEISEESNQHYFSMELVDGPNLADFARQHPISIRHAAQLLQKIAHAVQYAHEQGIVHRDLKPSNILIDGLLEPRLTDFGLARDLESDADLTLTGQVLGSPNYISPEQASGTVAIGPATDIYSLGAILYHLLTGRPPFAAETLTATLQQVTTTDPVSPRILNPSVPRDLETICLKCLEKEPHNRYPTAAALAAELERFLRDEPIHARPIGAPAKALRWCRRKPVIASLAAAFAISLLLGFAGVLWQWQRAERNLYFSTMRQVRDELEQESIGRARELLEEYFPNWWKNDLRGWEWYYAWNECQGNELFSLHHPRPVFSVALSRDGTVLAVAAEGQPARLWNLEKRAVLGESGPILRALTFSSDEKEIIGGTADGLVIAWNLQTGHTNTVITNLSVASKFGTSTRRMAVRSLMRSPDGRFLAVYSHHGLTIWKTPNYEHIASFPLTTGSDNLPAGIAFSPDSRLLAYSREGGEIILWDIARKIDAATLQGHEQNVTGLVFSKDGSTLISGSRDRTVSIWDVKSGRALKTIRGFVAFVTGLSLSPDGRRLAVVGAGQYVRLFEVPSWQEVNPLKGHTGESRSVMFSPDGNTIISAGNDGKVRVWLASAAENSTSQRLPPGHSAVGFLPGAGMYIEYTNRTYTFWNAGAPAEDSPKPIPLRDAGPSTMSPDGRLWAVATTNAVRLFDHRTRQWVLDLPIPDAAGPASWDPRPSPSKGGVNVAARGLAFSADSEFLAFCGQDNLCRVWKINSPGPTGARSRSLASEFKVMGNKLWNLKFSRDGRLLVIAHYSQTVEIWNMGLRKKVELVLPGDTLPDISISRDESIAATASGSGPLVIWDLRSGRVITSLGGQLGTLWSVEFSPDDTRIAACGGDGIVRIWDRKTFQEVSVLRLHHDRLWQLAFSTDGETLSALGQDSLGGLRLFTLRAPRL